MLTAFLTALVVALLVAPSAIAVAHRTGFLDRPAGYKGHTAPTPYLGGAVVLFGFVAGAVANRTVEGADLAPVLVGAAALWLVGTIDDRVALGPRVRVIAEILAAIVLWRSDLGWSVFPGEAADLLLTILWVVGLVNAFNLMDNQDGAAGTVAAISAVGIGALGAQNDVDSLSALAFAVSGACVGFLYYNLSKPARIFLGDGGSMLIGFLVAALSMATWRDAALDGIDLLPMILLVGLPVLDMTLVIVSRLRRGMPVGKGARDHLTHRLRSKLGSTRLVAFVLAVAQGALCVIALEIVSWSEGSVLAAAGIAFVMGVATIAVLELPTFTAELPTRRAKPGRVGVAGEGLRRDRPIASPGESG